MEGWKIEVAIPYSQVGGNIFLAARVARIQGIEGGNVILCGVSYLHSPHG
jgi:hypothetical protein